MTVTSAFESFLVPERSRRKAARDGGFAIPAFLERVMAPSDQPFLATNARRGFVHPGLRLGDGMVRYGFSKCPLEEESDLLAVFFRSLWATSERSGWLNRCTNITAAKQILEDYGLLPRSLIVSFPKLREMCGQGMTIDEARKLTLAQGCVTEVDGIRVLFSELPEGQMILGTAPPMVGLYTRIDDHVGLLLRKVNQSVVLINELAR